MKEIVHKKDKGWIVNEKKKMDFFSDNDRSTFYSYNRMWEKR